MAKRFKAKKRKKVKKHFVFLFVLFAVTFIATFKLFQKIKVHSSHKEVVYWMLEDGNHYLQTSNKQEFVQVVGDFLFHFDASQPLSILSGSLLYQQPAQEKIKPVLMKNEQIVDETDHVIDPNPMDITKPKVYIYNTHQTEEYKLENAEVHNITPNVMLASYVLKEKLNDLSVPTIVEERSVSNYLNQQHWAYYKSYQVSKIFMKEAINKYPSLTYLIDVHRDALRKDLSTVEMNGVSYAKLLFVVGLDHPNYQPNLDLATKLNEAINAKYPELSRGISTKKGDDVNGIYNQDVSGNTILIECGGNENTIEEVSNTMNLFAEVFKEVIS